MSTLERYTLAHFKAAPQGMLMPTYADDSNLKKLFQTGAQALLDLQNEADDQLDEVFPDVAGSYIDDWENVLGLPLSGLEDLTTTQRLAFIKNWLNISPYSNAAFFIDIAETAGYTIDIEEYEIDDVVDSEDLGDEAYYYFGVIAPDTSPQYFRAGTGAAGEALVDYNQDALENLINFFRPAHSIPLFFYTLNIISLADGADLTANGTDTIVWS